MVKSGVTGIYERRVENVYLEVDTSARKTRDNAISYTVCGDFGSETKKLTSVTEGRALLVCLLDILIRFSDSNNRIVLYTKSSRIRNVYDYVVDWSTREQLLGKKDGDILVKIQERINDVFLIVKCVEEVVQKTGPTKNPLPTDKEWIDTLDGGIHIYTDGAVTPNPGTGGYAAIIDFNGRRQEISGGYRYTTNNRMELMAVLKAIDQVPTTECPVHVYSDSTYVVNSLNNWVYGWLKQPGGLDSRPNGDLFKRFLEFTEDMDIRCHWIKGHNGYPENERCDKLAGLEVEKEPTEIDTVYEEDAKLYYISPKHKKLYPFLCL